MTGGPSFFPAARRGESLYSQVAAFQLWHPDGSVVRCNEEMFGRRFVKASPDLPAFVGLLAARLPAGPARTAERLAVGGTQISYSTAFVPRETAADALRLMTEGDPSLHLFLGLNASVVCRPARPHYCPECLPGMRAAAGRLWWRLDHQLPGVLVCPGHRCALLACPTSYDDVSDHAFIAATDANCPVDGEPLVVLSTPRLAASLLDVARRSAALLTAEPGIAGYEELTAEYRTRLRRGGMFNGTRLDVRRFLAAFRLFHGELLEVLAPVFGKLASPEAWMLEMARRQLQAKHPLQHVLFRMFLDSLPDEDLPFGPGPWRCPNPVAEHGPGALTIVDLAEKRMSYGLVGTFRCACGYAYTHTVRYDGRVQKPRLKCFGPLLDPALIRLVAEGATLRGTAEALGVHPRAVAAAAKRLGLGKAWTSHARGPRIGRPTADAPSRRVLDPKPARNPGRPRVAWEALDANTLARVREIVKDIKAAKPPVQVSLREVERRHRGLNWIYLRRAKLPLTMAFLDGVRESVEAFQLRRLEAVIADLVDRGLPLVPSNVVRAASLRSEVWGARARKLIEASRPSPLP